LQHTEHELSDPAALAFCRERLAAVSNALEAWPRCERAACRRAGECKGESETLPRCLPVVTAVIRVCVASCVSTVPEPEARGGERPSFNQRLHQLMHRSMGILEHHMERMENLIERRN
jgi:hypothetical protein